MDGFTYVNIFDTKGIEYLIIIGFLILIIPFWLLLNKPMYLKKQMSNALSILSESILRIPQGLFFNKNHTWTHLDRSGNAKVGIDDWLMHITGNVQVDHLRTIGEKVSKGEAIIQLNKDGKQLMIASPISGEIKSLNLQAVENPDLISEDPYFEGWLYQIKPQDWLSETSSYYLAEEATAWAKRELFKFKSFYLDYYSNSDSKVSSAVMQEGGELIDHPLAHSSGEVWNAFQDKFLKIEKEINVI